MLPKNQWFLALGTSEKYFLSVILSVRIYYLYVFICISFSCPLVLSLFVASIDPTNRVFISAPEAPKLSVKLFSIRTQNPQRTIREWTKSHVSPWKLKVNLESLLYWLHSPMKSILFTRKEEEVIRTTNS